MPDRARALAYFNFGSARRIFGDSKTEGGLNQCSNMTQPTNAAHPANVTTSINWPSRRAR
jgi:hypothetical protein